MNRLQAWFLRATGISEIELMVQEKLEQIEKRDGFDVYLEAVKSNRIAASGAVTPGNSLQVAAVWACVRVIAETVASLPLIIYERQERGKRRAPEHPLYSLLHDQANPQMTAFEYRETMQSHLALWGNAYGQIIYDDRGQAVELWPLRPDRMIGSRMVDGVRWYQYQQEDGRFTWFVEDEIWHIRGLGGDGMNGYSPIGLMRRSIGLAKDAEEFGERFFQNDARPGIIIEHPGKLGDTAHKHIKESLEEEHQGVSKSHRPMILEEGMKLHEVGIPPEDAQFLETRQFQVREIARIFRVPPHMIGDLEQATFSNIEHQALEFVVHSVRPWLVRWEQSISSNLMLPRDRTRFYAEHLVDGLLRGDITSRYQAYAVARSNGWMSANDIRELENQNPIDNGDMYLVPLNMIPADQVGNLGSTETPPAPASTARSLPPDAENRALRSATARHRLGLAQRRVIQDVAERAMRRETHDVGDAVQKYFSKRDSGQFLIWLEEFYRGHADWLKRQFLPIFTAYMELVAGEVQDELAREENDREHVERFANSYSGSFAAQQVGISQYRLKQRIQEAANSGEDVATALNGELEHWSEARPAEIAVDQSTRAGNAVAKVIYQLAGIQILRWVTMGATCPYCKSLNGRKISITRFFLTPGDKLEAPDAEPLTTTTNIGHPPAHDGCDCLILAG